jgi:hypothetical protein
MRHLIKKKDGSVAIMTTVSDDIDPSDEFLKWSQEANDEIESHRPMEESEIPQDRYFRGAWIHKDDSIDVDIDKAKNIHRDVIRELRKPLLEALDIEFTRASESKDESKMKELIDKKNALRDVTQHSILLNASTPEEIKSFMPEILK